MTAFNSFVSSYLQNHHHTIWNERLDRLENYLKRMTADGKKSEIHNNNRFDYWKENEK